jgi:hypothetical protein
MHLPTLLVKVQPSGNLTPDDYANNHKLFMELFSDYMHEVFKISQHEEIFGALLIGMPGETNPYYINEVLEELEGNIPVQNILNIKLQSSANVINIFAN